MNLTIVAGARPNFVKIAPLIWEIHKLKISNKQLNYRLVHTGQHYDTKMSAQFFHDLEIPQPHVNLNAGSGSQAEITAHIMLAFEKELIQHPTDLVIVVGDVTSTLACTITAKKLLVKVAHIEAGIRSFDLNMPEEINRMVTDSISDYFFTTTESATQLLKNIGKNEDHIFFVGNIMIDTLMSSMHKLRKPQLFDRNNLIEKKYFVLTLHRPSNVDDAEKLLNIIEFICNCTSGLPIVFPVHPRTKKNFSFNKTYENLILAEPLGYLEFNYLVNNAMGVITDSGGITEEATVLNIPCISLRDTTERPETVNIGTNVLAGNDFNLIKKYIDQIITKNWKKGKQPRLWDGKTAMRIVNNLLLLSSSSI